MSLGTHFRYVSSVNPASNNQTEPTFLTKLAAVTIQQTTTSNSPTSACSTSSSPLIACATSDHTINLYNLSEGSSSIHAISSLQGHSSPITDIQFHGQH